jgi:hypothetical protein
MEKIFENKSLRFICNAINTGMIEIEELNNLKIISDFYNNIFIKILDISIIQQLAGIFEKDEKLKNDVDFIETNIHDYIVFMKEKTSEGTTLKVISLLELVNISPNIVKDDEQKRDNNSIIWSLDENIWNLIEEKD